MEDISFSNFIVPVTAILSVLALSASSIGIQRTIIAAYTQNFPLAGSSLIASGITLSLFGTAKALGNYAGGIFSDVVNRKQMIIGGTFVIFLGNLNFLFIPGLPGYIIGNTMLGAGAGLVFASGTIALTDMSGLAKRSMAISMMELSVYVGTAIGSLIASFVNLRSVQTLLAFSSILALITIMIGFTLIKDSKHLTLEETQTLTVSYRGIQERILDNVSSFNIEIPEKFQINLAEKISDTNDVTIPNNITQGLREFIRKPNIIVIILTGMVSRLLDAAFILLFPLYIFYEYGFDTAFFGTLNTFFLIFWAIGIISSPKVVNVFGRRLPLIIGVFSEFLGFYYLFQTSEPWLMGLLTCFSGFMLGIYYPLPSAALADLVPPVMRGRMIGIYRLMLDMGYLLASILFLLNSEFVIPFLFNQTVLEKQLFHLLMFVVISGIFHSFVLIFFLRDSRPAWPQFPYLARHIGRIKLLSEFVTRGIALMIEGNPNKVQLYYKQAKHAEVLADSIIDELTQKTYSGAFPKKDAIEILNMAATVDKAAGNHLRTLKRLISVETPLPPDLLLTLSFFSATLMTLVEYLEKSVTGLKIGLSVAINHALEVGFIEEYLDLIHNSLMMQVREADIPNLFDLLSVVNAVEFMEKSANQLEDASEIIKLLGYKYYIQ